MVDLNQVPGDPEVWLVDGVAYIVYVYDFDDMKGELPVSWKITGAELKTAFGDKPVKYDKTMTSRQFNSTGALNFGSYIGLATFEHDPMTEWLDNFEKESKVRPWLQDPEVASIYLGAYLEGREPTDAEFENTEWWRTHNSEQRQWLLLSESDPASAAKLKRDNRLFIAQGLRDAGIAHAGADVVTWLNDQYTSGNWSQDYLELQVRHLSDPATAGKMDKQLRRFLDGDRPEGTRAEEDTVQELAAEWLGPMHGNMNNREIERWAGRLRNDPDAKQEFIAKLKKQRLTLFKEYDDENTTYEDIAAGRRQEWEAILGEQPNEAKDKAWIKYLRTNDIEAGGELIRQTGIDRGSESVARDAVRDTMAAFSTVRAPQ